MPNSTTGPLRLALLSNSGFSFFSAILLIVRPDMIGALIGVQSSFVLQVIGAGLLLFAIDLLHQASRSRMATWRALYACIGDVLWVFGTIVLLVLFPGILSETGSIVAMGVAVIVMGFAIWQYWGIARAHRSDRRGTYRHCIAVAVNAPADAMWRVIGSYGDIRNYMPSLKRSEIVDGKSPGVGAVRACEDRSGRCWAEECIRYDKGHRLDVRFLAEARDFPFPAKEMIGGWIVEPSSPGSQVMVWWELKPKRLFLTPILLPLLAFQVDREFPRVIRRMAARALFEQESAAEGSGTQIEARLLPLPC